MKCFLPRGKDYTRFDEIIRLNATPDIRVRVRRIVITVPIPQTRVRRVVPIPANRKDGTVGVRVGECA